MYSDSGSRVEVAIYDPIETSLNLKRMVSSNHLYRRIVVQVRTEPALDFGHDHALALGIVGHLIAVDLAQAEVARLRGRKVEATYAGAGPHGEGLRDQHAGVLLHIKQLPERALLGVIGTCRVTRGRA